MEQNQHQSINLNKLNAKLSKLFPYFYYRKSKDNLPFYINEDANISLKILQ